MKNIKMFVIILFIMISAMGCEEKKEVLKEKRNEISFENQLIGRMIESETEGNFCIINTDMYYDLIIPEQYHIKTTAYTGTTYEIERSNDDYLIEETERYEVGVYDFHTLKLIKTLDMKKIMEPYLEEWEIRTIGCWLGEYEGKKYLVNRLRKKQTDEEIITKKDEEIDWLWIDIENETASWIDKEPEPINKDGNDNIWMLVGTTILDANGYEDTYVRNEPVLKDTSYITIPTNKLPEKNEKLYSLFPELKNVSREEDMYAHILLHPQTNNMEAISLILNDGDRLNFEALEPDDDGYYGDYNDNNDNNGERHYITKEEYEQFQRDYEEYFGKEE